MKFLLLMIVSTIFSDFAVAGMVSSTSIGPSYIVRRTLRFVASECKTTQPGQCSANIVRIREGDSLIHGVGSTTVVDDIDSPYGDISGCGFDLYATLSGYRIQAFTDACLSTVLETLEGQTLTTLINSRFQTILPK